jgi:TonB family protein
MKSLLICLVALPMFAFAGQDDFTPPSQFPPLSDAVTAAVNNTQDTMLKQAGVARVGFYEFTIDDKGKLTKIGIARSSGDATDDDEAIAAIEATKFDASPAGKQTYHLIPIRFTAQETIYIPPAGGK